MNSSHVENEPESFHQDGSHEVNMIDMVAPLADKPELYHKELIGQEIIGLEDGNGVMAAPLMKEGMNIIGQEIIGLTGDNGRRQHL